jgi:outer membrane protein assembly factor BamE (lipoprotein component of BamABCDE complex)
MPRRRFEDDDEYAAPLARPSKSPVGIVLAVFGVVALLGVAACAGFAVLGFRASRDAEELAVQAESEAKAAAKAGPPKRTVYDRAKFRELVMGKSPDEVIAAVGRPDSTSEAGGVFWYYSQRTRDTGTGMLDSSAKLVIRDGKVSEVSFH